MTTKLDIKHESIDYTGVFDRPLLAFVGDGRTLVRAVYEAFTRYSVSLQNIQINNDRKTVGDPVLTAQLGSALVKVSYEKIEIAVNPLSDETFLGFPLFLESATGWLFKISEDFGFKAHLARYYCHGLLDATSVDDFLIGFTPRKFETLGQDKGSATVMYRFIEAEAWNTKIMFDKSLVYPNGLYVGLEIQFSGRKVDYLELVQKGQQYVWNAFREVGIYTPLMEQDDSTKHI